LPDFDLQMQPAWLSKVNDSKKLSASVRQSLVPEIQGWALSSAVGLATVEEIERLNILQAAYLAMQRAIEALSVKAERVLMDGKHVPSHFPQPVKAVVQGDSKCLSVACASILAKVWRDQLMGELDGQFPGYDLAKCKGYGTKAHLQGLQELGVTSIHRKSFKPVADLLHQREKAFSSQVDLFK
jgi:ribonuclease HII